MGPEVVLVFPSSKTGLFSAPPERAPGAFARYSRAPRGLSDRS